MNENKKQVAALQERFGDEVRGRAMAAIQYFIPPKYQAEFNAFLESSGAGNDPDFIQGLARMSFDIKVFREIRVR